MITRIVVSTVASLLVVSIAFSQMKYSRPRPQAATPTPTPPAPTATPPSTQLKSAPVPAPKTAAMQTQSPAAVQRTTTGPIQPRSISTPAPIQAKPTPTPVPPPDVKAYLDRQVANSKDKKFHMTVNGKDLPLTPFHFWPQKSTSPDSTSTCIDMRSDEGRIYDIDFVTTGSQVTAVKIHKINGEVLR